MKIAFAGFELPEGKVKYNDAILADLEGKFKPDKVSPYYIELLPDGFEAAEGIAIARDFIPADCRSDSLENLNPNISFRFDGGHGSK